jgi:hypothetical protein
MSAFTDHLYDHWRRSCGDGGVLMTTGRSALPGRLGICEGISSCHAPDNVASEAFDDTP